MEVGLIGEEILNGAIVSILVTCIIGPVLVEKYGYRLAGQSELELNEKTSVQQRVLVPIANPATTDRLLEFASNLKVDSDDHLFPDSVLSSHLGGGFEYNKPDRCRQARRPE